MELNINAVHAEQSDLMVKCRALEAVDMKHRLHADTKRLTNKKRWRVFMNTTLHETNRITNYSRLIDTPEKLEEKCAEIIERLKSAGKTNIDENYVYNEAMYGKEYADLYTADENNIEESMKKMKIKTKSSIAESRLADDFEDLFTDASREELEKDRQMFISSFLKAVKESKGKN